LALSRIRRFIALVEAHRPGAILIFASSGLSFLEKSLLAAYGRLRGAGVVMSIRSGHFMDACYRSGVFRGVAHVLLRGPHYLLCQGRQWQEFFNEVFNIPESLCPIINGWVATQALLEIGMERRAKSAGTVELLFLGRVERYKGVLELLEAVRTLVLSKDVPQFHLTVAGGGGALDEAHEWARSNGLEQWVTFAGWVGTDAVATILERADVFILPSYTEGLPNAMIEAMATGLPVIVTPVGSIPDVVVSGQEGIVVPVGDVNALAAAMRWLIVDPDVRTRMGRQSYKQASSRFSVESGASSLSSLLIRASESVR
jgi:glycosyltransferase involved in cell wall biosynthesis